MNDASPPQSDEREESPAGDLTGLIPTMFLPALLLTVFCLSPFGLLAIVSGRRTKAKLATGDYAGALASTARTRRLLRTGFSVAVACGAVLILLQILFTF